MTRWKVWRLLPHIAIRQLQVFSHLPKLVDESHSNSRQKDEERHKRRVFVLSVEVHSTNLI